MRLIHMLNDWLIWSERTPPPFTRFSLIDVEEAQAPTDKIRTFLCQLLVESRFEPGLLDDLRSLLGSARAQAVVASAMARGQSARRGQFGEVLSSAMLAGFHGYVIPVPKLRFLVLGDQSQPGTDVVALRLDDQGRVIEVCFVESKLRTTANADAAMKGCLQLRSDYDKGLPDMLLFVAARLREQASNLYSKFAEYLESREDNSSMDTFRLYLVWDRTNSIDSALGNLEDAEIALSPLTVHTTLIRDLGPLTDELFASVGITEVVDDD